MVFEFPARRWLPVAAAVFCWVATAAAEEPTFVPAEPPGPGTKVLSFDKSGDKIPDKWAVFVNDKVAEIGYDRNLDGKADFWEFLNPGGRMARTETDRNHDGIPDLIVHYANGYLSFKLVDDNYDKIPDRVVYFDGTQQVGLASEDIKRLEKDPAAAMEPSNRPAVKAPAPPPTVATAPRPAKKSQVVTPAAEEPAAKEPAAVALTSVAHDVAPPSPPETAYFPLGPDFPVRIPVPGGGDALAENRTWNVERERKLFKWPDNGTGFELQHLPSQGAIKISVEPLAQGSGGLAGRERAFARRTFGRLVYVGDEEQTISTPLGQGQMNGYLVKQGKNLVRVSLCTILAPGYSIYVLAVSPRATHRALRSALLEMLQGARIG